MPTEGAEGQREPGRGSVSRLDHCFMLASGRDRAMVFCRAEGFDRDAARERVESTLRADKGYPRFELAYLGVLDYREMESQVEGMLEPFEILGPVWLAYFRWEGAAEVGD